MRRLIWQPAVLSFASLVLFAGALPAQERDPGWEIFSPTEQQRDEGLTLDPEDDPGVPKPEFSLDELSNPTSYDPDVFIRYSAGREKSDEQSAEPAPRVEPPAEQKRENTLPVPPGGTPEASENRGMVSPITTERLTNLKSPIPVVNTRAEYREALANREPEILFEGKRWVFSEETGGYVDPRAAALEEARRVQQALRAERSEIVPATGAYGYPGYPGPWPEVQTPGTFQPPAEPLGGAETEPLQDEDQSRVPGVVSGRENEEGNERNSRRNRGLRTSPVYGGSR